jgi:hypothetical protein
MDEGSGFCVCGLAERRNQLFRRLGFRVLDEWELAGNQLWRCWIIVVGYTSIQSMMSVSIEFRVQG